MRAERLERVRNLHIRELKGYIMKIIHSKQLGGYVGLEIAEYFLDMNCPE